MSTRVITRIVLWSVCSLIALMWVYAFVFAPRESVNKIKDEAWTVRAEAHCQIAENVRFALEDLTEMDPNDSLALKKKAQIVEKATDALEVAINSIEDDKPSDEKGKAIVPLWITEYRMYIENRRLFAQELMTSKTRPYFAETEIEGVPVSERLGKFARENKMKSCQPPLDLSV
mgnify:CR=1 FL=1